VEVVFPEIYSAFPDYLFIIRRTDTMSRTDPLELKSVMIGIDATFLEFLKPLPTTCQMFSKLLNTDGRLMRVVIKCWLPSLEAVGQNPWEPWKNDVGNYIIRMRFLSAGPLSIGATVVDNFDRVQNRVTFRNCQQAFARLRVSSGCVRRDDTHAFECAANGTDVLTLTGSLFPFVYPIPYQQSHQLGSFVSDQNYVRSNVRVWINRAECQTVLTAIISEQMQSIQCIGYPGAYSPAGGTITILTNPSVRPFTLPEKFVFFRQKPFIYSIEGCTRLTEVTVTTNCPPEGNVPITIVGEDLVSNVQPFLRIGSDYCEDLEATDQLLVQEVSWAWSTQSGCRAWTRAQRRRNLRRALSFLPIHKRRLVWRSRAVR